MAVSKTKRSNRRPDSRKRAGRKTQTRNASRRHPRVFRFSQAKGKVVEEVELFIDPSYNGLTLKFQDNTSLNFEFATGFAVEAYLSRWKAGNEHVFRHWPHIHSEPVF